MIDKNNILDSGILERYLTGDLSQAQMKDVDELILQNPEIKERFSQLEADFEQLAMENAVSPPSSLKSKLLGQFEDASKKERVAPINSGRNMKPYLAIAASLVLFFGLSSLWLFNKLDTIQKELKTVIVQKEELNNSLKEMVTNYDEMATWYTAINDPNTTPWILKGNELSPKASAICYLNSKNKTAFINTLGLPQLSADKDYQLWADVDGVMINMGVIEKNTEFLAMTYIENAASLNITIEPIGGSDHPTVSNLISNVYL